MKPPVEGLTEPLAAGLYEHLVSQETDSRIAQRLSRRHFTEYRQRHRQRPAGGIATKQFNSRRFRKIEQAACECIQPCVVKRGQRQRQGRVARRSAHRREVREVYRQRLVAEFAGIGNTEGVRQLLDLGVSAGARFEAGDGYWDLAQNSTALHVAAWRMRPTTVRLLVERGAPLEACDGKGRTPLQMAVKACVDSYWSERRTPESVPPGPRSRVSPTRARCV